MADPNSPTLLTPSYGSIIVGNVLIFTFNIPIDLDGDDVIFKIEFDTDLNINNSHVDYKASESRFAVDKYHGHGVWEYYNGATWAIMPTGGVDTGLYAGNQARATLNKIYTDTNYPDKDASWYWRILASDDVCDNPIFNQVIFGHCHFSS